MVPKVLRDRVVRLAHEGHPTLCALETLFYRQGIKIQTLCFDT